MSEVNNSNFSNYITFINQNSLYQQNQLQNAQQNGYQSNIQNQNSQNSILLNNQQQANLIHNNQQLQQINEQQAYQSEAQYNTPSKINDNLQEKLKLKKQLEEQLKQLQSEVQVMEQGEIKSGIRQENSFMKDKQINRRFMNNNDSSNNDEYFRRILELEKERKTLKQSKQERMILYENALKQQIFKEKEEAMMNIERMKQLQKIKSERGFSQKQRSPKEENYNLKETQIQSTRVGNQLERIIIKQSLDLEEKKKQLAKIRELSTPKDYVENNSHQEQPDMELKNREQRSVKSDWQYEKPKVYLSQNSLKMNSDASALQMEQESNQNLRNEIQDPFSSQKKKRQMSSHVIRLNNSQISTRSKKLLPQGLTSNNIFLQIQENLAKKRRQFDSKDDKKKFFDFVQQEYRKVIGSQYMGSSKNQLLTPLNLQNNVKQVIDYVPYSQNNTPYQSFNANDIIKPIEEQSEYNQRTQRTQENQQSPGKVTGIDPYVFSIKEKLSLINQIQDESYDIWKQRHKSRIVKSGTNKRVKRRHKKKKAQYFNQETVNNVYIRNAFGSNQNSPRGISMTPEYISEPDKPIQSQRSISNNSMFLKTNNKSKDKYIQDLQSIHGDIQQAERGKIKMKNKKKVQLNNISANSALHQNIIQQQSYLPQLQQNSQQSEQVFLPNNITNQNSQSQNNIQSVERGRLDNKQLDSKDIETKIQHINNHIQIPQERVQRKYSHSKQQSDQLQQQQSQQNQQNQEQQQQQLQQQQDIQLQSNQQKNVQLSQLQNQQQQQLHQNQQQWQQQNQSHQQNQQFDQQQQQKFNHLQQQQLHQQKKQQEQQQQQLQQQQDIQQQSNQQKNVQLSQSQNQQKQQLHQNQQHQQQQQNQPKQQNQQLDQQQQKKQKFNHLQQQQQLHHQKKQQEQKSQSLSPQKQQQKQQQQQKQKPQHLQKKLKQLQQQKQELLQQQKEFGSQKQQQQKQQRKESSKQQNQQQQQNNIQNQDLHINPNAKFIDINESGFSRSISQQFSNQKVKKRNIFISIMLQDISDLKDKYPLTYNIQIINKSQVIKDLDGVPIDVEPQDLIIPEDKGNIAYINDTLEVNYDPQKLYSHYEKQISDLFIFFRIIKEKDEEETLFGWLIQPLFKDNQLNQGEFKEKLFSPPDNISFPFNKSQYKQMPISISFKVSESA